MGKISLETQLKALYEKANSRKAPESAESAADKTNFNDTLKSSIERMNEISSQADNALKELPSEQEGISAEIAEAGKIHKRMMEEQHNLAALYGKLNLKSD